MAKRKKKPKPNAPASGTPFRIPMANPVGIDVQKIKQDAVNEALRLLEPKFKLAEAEREKIRKEAYDKALEDAMRYFTVLGSRALNNKYRFGYIRLERYIDEIMRLMSEENIDEAVRWFEKIGFKLTIAEIEKE